MMGDILAGFVLAAGAGTRLHPLTFLRPKALVPVGTVPLLDRALERLVPAVGSGADHLAVNVHHLADRIVDHVAATAVGVHVSREEVQALGTAGALGHARSWIDGRAVLVSNVDAWHEADLHTFAQGWDGERIRVLVARGRTLEPTSRIVASILPWSEVARLPAEPAGLYEVSWRLAAEADRLEVVSYDGPFVDCGTPADYLHANLLASGGASVVGEGAVIEGEIERCVVWDGARVNAGEHLVDAIRAGFRTTVLVR
jgi:NDP-sugar pyrophosphorylase family protein